MVSVLNKKKQKNNMTSIIILNFVLLHVYQQLVIFTLLFLLEFLDTLDWIGIDWFISKVSESEYTEIIFYVRRVISTFFYILCRFLHVFILLELRVLPTSYFPLFSCLTLLHLIVIRRGLIFVYLCLIQINFPIFYPVISLVALF